MKFNNLTILITGASSGIGAELARQLAERDCRLILIARREELLQKLIERLKGGPERHRCCVCDVADSVSIAAVCHQLKSEGLHLDGMILNAGVGGGFNAAAMDLDSIRYQFKVNFWGTVEFIAHLLPLLLQQRQGFVAATASLAGYRGMPGSAPYSAAKSALSRFIESTRIDCHGQGVHFAVISPGFVKTPMTDKNNYPMPFMISVEKAARIIIRGLEKKKYEIRFPRPMVLIVKLGQLLPESLYLSLLSGHRKPRDAAATNS
jgi:short-subunit dehydrogenase